ncbi:hypothetical protein [Radiobacillus sp. PE A8.2]|uniref:hypothetical protein n=1 Tax=Radiobacillus sp. PE A8.2 TaxID=3380349 RepID=UPI003890779C
MSIQNLLLISTAWQESLSYRSITGTGQSQGWITPGVIPDLPEIKMINIPDARPRIQQLLFDVMNKHQAYDAASDYRALAFYPEFLEQSWRHVRGYVGSSSYTLWHQNIKKREKYLVHSSMPYPVSISPSDFATIYPPKDIAALWGWYRCILIS